MRKTWIFVSLLGFFLLFEKSTAAERQWDEGFLVPIEGQDNPFVLAPTELQASKARGQVHAQFYPIQPTGLLVPQEPLRYLFEDEKTERFREWLQQFLQANSPFKTFRDFTQWLGLHDYPKESDQGVYSVAYPGGQRPSHQMGVGWIQRNGTSGLTFSCASCHSGTLFGKTVLGLSNRFPRANDIFIQVQKITPWILPSVFQSITAATAEDTTMYAELRLHIQRVGTRQPLLLGLDTSLAQVSLSLAKRNSDPWALPSDHYQMFPRPDDLAVHPADSKPAVWWNVKYKNRWLSDGSIVSGSPILTNILWNEIGRGADLRAISDWIDQNPEKIKDLTNAVFTSQPPKITDFFPGELWDLEVLKKGEKIFEQKCSRCHGAYAKAWNDPAFAQKPFKEQLQTLKVIYPRKTFVVDVGTDPWRAKGMRSLEVLNNLEISKRNGILIRAQKGYVPPPLLGIWSRWPYFHNNSVPSLQDVLTRSENRVPSFWMGEARDPVTDFDWNRNGYPLQAPTEWQTAERLYVTGKKGLSNQGHDEGIFLENGKELLSASEKEALLRYLQLL